MKKIIDDWIEMQEWIKPSNIESYILKIENDYEFKLKYLYDTFYKILCYKNNLIVGLIILNKECNYETHYYSQYGIDKDLYLCTNESFIRYTKVLTIEEELELEDNLTIEQKITVLENYVNNIDIKNKEQKIYKKITRKKQKDIDNKKIVRLDKDGEIIKTYSSASEIETDLGIRKYTVLNICKLKKGVSKKSTFRFEEDMTEFDKDEFINTFNKSENYGDREIIKLDLNDNILNTFKSLRDVKNDINSDTSNVIRCCNNEYKQAYGFKWKWKKTI